MKTSIVHPRVFYCPNLAIRAATRAAGQRLTIRLPEGSTSTPSPAPSTTLPRPADRATLTRPSTTNTEVFPPSASIAHFVPRTAAIACGVTTLNRVRPGFFGTSSSRALLLSSMESTRPSRLRSLSSNFAPLSATIVIAVGQRSVCDPCAVGEEVQPSRLGRCRCSQQAEACHSDSFRRVPVWSWQLPLRGRANYVQVVIRSRITRPTSGAERLADDNMSASGG